MSPSNNQSGPAHHQPRHPRKIIISGPKARMRLRTFGMHDAITTASKMAITTIVARVASSIFRCQIGVKCRRGACAPGVTNQ
jgi:hypothetical protein